METQEMQSLFTKMVIAEWDKQNSHFTKLVYSLTDEQLSKPIAPGRNTGIYLLGHLIAVHDAMLQLLGFGDKLYPALENTFIRSPDGERSEKPSIAELKNYLEAVNVKLSSQVQSTSVADWFKKHTAVSEEDFAREPHRNRLNVLINRSGHLSYHLGQLILLKDNDSRSPE